MNAMDTYFETVENTLRTARQTQREALETAAGWIAEATLAGRAVFAFGCSHAGLLAFELYYRTGGMANVNPVRAPGMYLDIDPAVMTSQMERMPGYGAIIADNQKIKTGDVVLVHSVSGRNAVPVDFARRCREKGAKVICLTSLAAENALPSRHPEGLHLKDVADLVIDNCGVLGDGAVTVPGVPEKVGPTSTAVGAALVNAVVVRAVELIALAGGTPPVFRSANVPGGDEFNAALMEEYRDRIFYM